MPLKTELKFLKTNDLEYGHLINSSLKRYSYDSMNSLETCVEGNDNDTLHGNQKQFQLTVKEGKKIQKYSNAFRKVHVVKPLG
ncbi:hypothetical protein L484_015265 [Morus notabilis]|uniref:Uncharacterized protein n=1 Tax=Morus notabilis TaxID=981085 RepID=W9RTE9_9ROSA|nr:hypothetical protein L484_015265 [Morus notabilis]